MIALDFYHSTHHSALSYSLDDGQMCFTRLPNEWFDDHSQAYKIAVLSDHQAIGFFVLDNGRFKYNYTDNDNALLLRSMSVNPQFQGKGYAKLALLQLKDFLKQHRILADEIVLGVNEKNTIAQSLYEKVGFKKVNRTYLGIKGLQYIYELGAL